MKKLLDKIKDALGMSTRRLAPAAARKPKKNRPIPAPTPTPTPPSPPPVQPLPPTPQPPGAVFADEFQTLSLDEAGNHPSGGRWVTWFHKFNVRHLKDNNDQCLKASPGYRGTGGKSLAEHGIVTHEIKDGVLTINAWPLPQELRAQFHNFPYVGGMISTELSHWQAQGAWECRARFESSKGHHWAMWLLPKDGSWPPEIDMVEIVNNDTWFYHASHGGGGVWHYWQPSDYRGWHVYRWEWKDGRMRWLVDGVERASCAAYFTKPMYFLITPEIGGNWPGAPDSSTQWPMRCQVDYVRAFA